MTEESSGDSVTLEFINGPLSGQSFLYNTEAEVTLGHRSGCDIVIPENNSIRSQYSPGLQSRYVTLEAKMVHS